MNTGTNSITDTCILHNHEETSHLNEVHAVFASKLTEDL